MYIPWLYTPWLTLIIFFLKIDIIQGERKRRAASLFVLDSPELKRKLFLPKKFSLTCMLPLTGCHIVIGLKCCSLKYLWSLTNRREVSLSLGFSNYQREGCFQSSPRISAGWVTVVFLQCWPELGSCRPWVWLAALSPWGLSSPEKQCAVFWGCGTGTT